MYPYALLIGIAAVGLSACDAAMNAGDNSPATEKETLGDIKLDKPSKTLDEALALDVFGVSLNMPVDQVKAVLLERGFSEPVPVSGGLGGFKASIGYDCERKYSGTDKGICDTIGTVQNEGYVWIRGQAVDGKAEEAIIPLFYIDEAGVQRLWHMGYERSYSPEIFPGNIAEQMVERFGAPTIHNSDESFEYLSYYIQMAVPAGYKRTESDDRIPSDFGEQRGVTKTRLECVKGEVKNFPEPISRTCQAIIDEPVMPQYLFDALGTSSNEALEINIKPDELRLELTGHFLLRAVEYAVEEIKLNEERAELVRRREAGGDVADDL